MQKTEIIALETIEIPRIKKMNPPQVLQQALEQLPRDIIIKDRNECEVGTITAENRSKDIDQIVKHFTSQGYVNKSLFDLGIDVEHLPDFSSLSLAAINAILECYNMETIISLEGNASDIHNVH